MSGLTWDARTGVCADSQKEAYCSSSDWSHETLSPVVRRRFERALEGHAEAVGEGALEGRWGCVSFNVSEPVLEMLKSRLRKNSRDYEETRLALERPSDPAVRGFYDMALQGDDSDSLGMTSSLSCRASSDFDGRTGRSR